MSRRRHVPCRTTLRKTRAQRSSPQGVDAKFKFITAGSVVGVVVLVVASLAFAWYTRSFGNYSATYGSVGAVIVLMMWLYIAGLAILFGSEINALIEHHAADGKEKGERTPGQRERDPAARARAKEVAPQADSPASEARHGQVGRSESPRPLTVTEMPANAYAAVAGAMLVLAIVAMLRPRS